MDFDQWRTKARESLQKELAPHEVNWGAQPMSLFDLSDLSPSPTLKSQNFTVPKDFLELAKTISYARDEDKWDLLYRILYRLKFENPQLLNINVDPDIHRALLLTKAIRRDIHKLHAFVRFKKTVIDGQEHYLAWHKPEHLILKAGTPFFVRRFGDRPWSIFSPDESAHWDLQTLSFGKGLPQHQFKVEDSWDEAWKTYYKSIYNPARLNTKAMKLEMSPKYWSSLPEAELIPELVQNSHRQIEAMAQKAQKSAVVPADKSLAELKTLNRNCEACPLFAKAHNAVFGEGPSDAQLMIVGEQPGDEEDKKARVFVGPAGEVLNACLKAANLKRSKLYLTNAVKHFKWRPGGQAKARIHQRPSGTEMQACKPWLLAEVNQLKPKIIVALGSTAATATLGRKPVIGAERGQVFRNQALAPNIIISWHPSAILRANSEEERTQRIFELQEDLKLAASLLND